MAIFNDLKGLLTLAATLAIVTSANFMGYHAVENHNAAREVLKGERADFQGKSKPLRLPANSSAKKLLQYVRDESHRFAQHYHHLLRDKKLLKDK